MMRNACLFALIGAALAASFGAAGADIIKCVDREGHVTLTDQPCEPGAATVLLPGQAQGRQDPPERYPTPPLQPTQPAPGSRALRAGSAGHRAPLARDVTTLQAARAQLLLIDEGNKSRPPSGLARVD